MTLFKAMVRVPATSAIAKDAIVNTWYFDLTVPYSTVGTIINGNLKTFYDAFGTYRASGMAWTSATVTWYDMSQPKPRVPVDLAGLGLSSSVSTTTMPQEVALCFSFQGVLLSGTKQARRRGRIYLGPWAQVAMDNTTGRPANALLTALGTAGSAFKAADTASINYTWVVASFTENPAGFTSQVTNGWIDNAFDTQRRRGVAPSLKTLWS